MAMSFIALLPPYIALINLLPIYKHFHGDKGKMGNSPILRGESHTPMYRFSEPNSLLEFWLTEYAR